MLRRPRRRFELSGRLVINVRAKPAFRPSLDHGLLAEISQQRRRQRKGLVDVLDAGGDSR